MLNSKNNTKTKDDRGRLGAIQNKRPHKIIKKLTLSPLVHKISALAQSLLVRADNTS